MKTILFFITLFLVFSLDAGERVALIIGNSDYPEGSRFGDLENPAADADLIGSTLEDSGFQVLSGKNANKTEIAELLVRFHNAIEPGGDAVFYFAGHGIEHENKNYLMASNSMFQNRFMLGEESIEVKTVLRAMEQKSPKSAIIFLDCCRDYPDDTWLTSGRGYRGRGLANIEGGDIMISYAAAPGAGALDGSDLGLENSPFAHALAGAIRKNLEITALFKAVRQEVHQISEGRQRTWENGSFLHDFYFDPVRPPGVQSPPSMKPERETSPVSMTQRNPGGATTSPNLVGTKLGDLAARATFHRVDGETMKESRMAKTPEYYLLYYTGYF